MSCSCLFTATYLKIKVSTLKVSEDFEMGLLDLLLVVAAILVIVWVLGLVIFNLGTIVWVLLVLAVIIIVVRLASGRRL